MSEDTFSEESLKFLLELMEREPYSDLPEVFPLLPAYYDYLETEGWDMSRYVKIGEIPKN